MYTISQLFTYPIKSLGGIELSAASLTDRGFQYDRRWMLVDSANQFLSQREVPAMSLLQTAIDDRILKVSPTNNPEDHISLSLQPSPNGNCTVKIWDDECEAWYVSDVADAWFSGKLGMPCRLVYMPDATRRNVDGRYASNNEITGFSDAYPLLIIGQASLDDLNSRLEKPLPMNRFRPNIVFTGGAAYDEDLMAHAVINGIPVFGVKLCARCPITTIDQTNAQKAKEPLKTLAEYRKRENNVYFGQNLLYRQTGEIKVGDIIKLISSKPAALFD